LIYFSYIESLCQQHKDNVSTPWSCYIVCELDGGKRSWLRWNFVFKDQLTRSSRRQHQQW